MFATLLCVLVLGLATPSLSATTPSPRCTNERNLQTNGVTCFADIQYSTGGSGKGIMMFSNSRSNCKQDTLCDMLKKRLSYGRPISVCRNPYCCIDTGDGPRDCNAAKALSVGVVLYFIIFAIQTLLTNNILF